MQNSLIISEYQNDGKAQYFVAFRFWAISRERVNLNGPITLMCSQLKGGNMLKLSLKLVHRLF